MRASSVILPRRGFWAIGGIVDLEIGRLRTTAASRLLFRSCLRQCA
jgi:hypothetical protein